MARLWSDVDAYLEETLVGADPVLQAVLDANRAAGLPAIDVSPLQGRFLGLMVRISGARRILEIGTLGGYSSICMARALPEGGTLTTLEFEPRHAETAQANFARAGVAERITLRLGRAADTLAAMVADGQGPFDLVFVDADKPGNATYIGHAVQMSRPGTVIICDNVVRDGAVADGASTDSGVIGSRAAIAAFGDRTRFEATALQTVGIKGYDGFAMAVVR